MFGDVICHLKLSDEPLSNVPNEPVGPVLFIIIPSDKVSKVNEGKLINPPKFIVVEPDIKKDAVVAVNIKSPKVVFKAKAFEKAFEKALGVLEVLEVTYCKEAL